MRASLLRFRPGMIALAIAAFVAAIVGWRAPVRPKPASVATAPIEPLRETPRERVEAAPPTRPTDLVAAVEWIRVHPEIDRGAALAMAFNAASADSDALVRCATELIRRDPTLACDAGNQLLFALGAAGEHARAARFAADAPAEFATAWLTAAYDRWGRSEPESAIANALALTEPGRRDLACRAALSGWAQTDPARLADCAANFPPGPEKTFSLVIALRAWSTTDALAASTWIRAHTAALAGVPGVEAILDN